MVSWVYVFSRFTAEALLFEALIICLLLASYAAFWVLRKRRMGAVEAEVPAGVVKTYLSELIVDAQQLQIQLFGLLQAAGISMPTGSPSPSMSAGATAAPAPAAGAGAAADPMLLVKVKELESKMSEQARAMETLLVEKQKIEKDLAEARAAGSATVATGEGGDNGALLELQKKIQLLEGKLSEYSVIEDDLANLKRLQQENAQLRSALGQGAPAAAAPGAAAPAAASAAEAPVAAEAAAPAEPQAEAPAAAGPDFEGLVDQVEQSLKPAAEAAAPAPEAAAPAAAEAPAAPAGNAVKSDADLLAEFEKMLNT